MAAKPAATASITFVIVKLYIPHCQQIPAFKQTGYFLPKFA